MLMTDIEIMYLKCILIYLFLWQFTIPTFLKCLYYIQGVLVDLIGLCGIMAFLRFALATESVLID